MGRTFVPIRVAVRLPRLNIKSLAHKAWEALKRLRIEVITAKTYDEDDLRIYFVVRRRNGEIFLLPTSGSIPQGCPRRFLVTCREENLRILDHYFIPGRKS